MKQYRLFVSCVTILLAVCGGAQAATYYVSTTGSTAGNGSSSSPWPSINYALTKVTGPGTTIIVRAGIYKDGAVVTLSGTASQPLVIRSEVKYGAKIVGANTYALKTETGANYVVLDGFDCNGAMNVGVYLKGNYNTVRNCWIHNSGSVGLGAYTLTGTLIENNLVEFNGQNPQFHHGIYADGTGLTIRNNIVRQNSALGMQLYPSISNSKIYNNLVIGHNKTGILLQSTSGAAPNQVFNNTSVENRTAIGIYNGQGDIIANNIATVASGDPIYVEGSVQSDYNLCQPSSKYMGPHGFNANPRFVDATRKCYWLLSSSPAIGKGTSQYAPPADFWGYTRSASTAPDIGAFKYYYTLTQPAARYTWYSGYPYRFNLDPGKDLPDLWASP
jgi:hypothetical protein